MARYTLIVKTSVEKDLKKIPRELVPSILSGIENLADNPFPRDSVKLSGAEHFYRTRAGDYRIIYHVLPSVEEVTVYYVRHRSIAYRTFS
jgi:mRNA interferase RelE/StbE